MPTISPKAWTLQLVTALIITLGAMVGIFFQPENDTYKAIALAGVGYILGSGVTNRKDPPSKPPDGGSSPT